MIYLSKNKTEFFMKKLLFTIHFSMLTLLTVEAQSVIQLWPNGKIPNDLKNMSVQEKSEVGKDGMLRISDITMPALTMYQPAKANGTSVLVIPGGGYWIEAAGHEGVDIAKWLNSFGVTAFVLKYRLPDERLWSNKHEVPLQDAMQAMRLIRENAVKYSIEPNKIGVMGFSAGGHLASTLCTHWQEPKSQQFFENVTDSGKVFRPNFAILMYPVITSGDQKHAGSFERLLGKNPTADLLTYYSNEKQVSATTPPTLLVHATNDAAVPVENSMLYVSALKKFKIPASLFVYEDGEHGFGLAQKKAGSVKNWPEHCLQWLVATGWVKR
jgi:acetyl esterase/lipase